MPHQSSQAYISPDQPAGTSAAKAEAAASRKNAEACAPGEATVMAEAAPEAGDGAGDAERAAGAASAKSEASSAAETGCARTGLRRPRRPEQPERAQAVRPATPGSTAAESGTTPVRTTTDRRANGKPTVTLQEKPVDDP